MSYSKITISGRICTGKTTLFWGLQEELIWPTFSTSQYFRDRARTHQLVLEKAEEQNDTLTKKVDYRVADMLQKSGNLLVEGWMAGLMANDYRGILKILLTCDDHVRIERFAQREKVSLEEAKKRIADRETNLFNRLTNIYQRNDFVEPKNYDLVLDTTNVDKTAMVKKVLRNIGY